MGDISWRNLATVPYVLLFEELDGDLSCAVLLTVGLAVVVDVGVSATNCI